MTAWMFIANPKDIANWRETEGPLWDKYRYKDKDGSVVIVWAIPTKSRDVPNIKRVKIDDIILCYHTYYRNIIGVSRCTRRWHFDKSRNFGNCIDISPIDFKQTQIRLKNLKNEKFRFISDYLYAPMGRAVVEVSRKDEPKFFRLYPNLPEIQEQHVHPDRSYS